MKREDLLQKVAEILCSQKTPHPLRVGINGLDASGKTYFADELARTIQGRHVIRASIDGFHNPQEIRYRKGRTSPEGYYHDSFDTRKFIDVLLEPLGPSGSLFYKTATFDYKTDSSIDMSQEEAKANSILIVDGIFLFRPELQAYWDIKIFIDVPFSLAMQRAVQRDGRERETEELRLQNQRYVPGQKLYFTESSPAQQAHILIENSDFDNPTLVVQSLS